jgi:hypothetical protein
MPGFDAVLLKPVNGVEVLLGLAWRGAVHELEEWMARVRLIQSECADFCAMAAAACHSADPSVSRGCNPLVVSVFA